VSHLQERKEKNCLNCNAQVMGKYCHICGQENIEPKETVLHLISHFFQDITHFDGKFFSTLKLLIARPGFLSAEYKRGRRASYLNPIRMYIFTSAFFFLIFFSFYKPDTQKITENSDINGKALKQVEAMDSAAFADFTRNINTGDDKADVPMTRQEFRKYYDSTITTALDNANVGVSITPGNYRSKEEYDSLLQSGAKKHNSFERALVYKQLEINKKYKGRKGEAFKSMVEIFLHKLPQMLFISLPLLALLFRLLYIRRKEFYYVNHAIFSIHFYIFVFIVLLVVFALGKINGSLHWQLITVLEVLLSFAMFFYLYKAMRNFYKQGRMKTILKFFILNFLFFIVMAVLFVTFMLLSVFSI
jgi:Protein of unknown function (DUF3667)